jgi:UDP-N-acetylmuramate dehydrogenase
MYQLDVKERFPLGELTTFNIGGPARHFTTVGNEEQAIEALSFAKERQLATFVLGGGSNILIGDGGFPGLVILNRIKGITSLVEGNSVTVTAGAGEEWDGFTKYCVENGLQGVECLAGVPGTVGAAPVQNIGAYGQSVDKVIESVKAIDSVTGETVAFTNEQCAFAYRTSMFNSSAAGRYVITQVSFRLENGTPPHIIYHDLKNYFAGKHDITLAQAREAALAVRSAKGLLVLDGYERFNSAGSFFKNPLVSAEQFKEIETAVEKTGGCDNWAWPQSSGDVKVSAACLIQSAGFVRGFRRGNVGISPRHTLAVVNYDRATAAEVIAFARQVQEKVKERFGVVLKPEVQFVGFTPDLL